MRCISVFFLKFCFFLITQTTAQTPRELAESIGLRLMAETKYEFVLKPMKLEQEKTHIIDLTQHADFQRAQYHEISFELEPLEKSNVLENGHGTGVVYLSLSHSIGKVQIVLDDSILFKSINSKHTQPKRLDYDFLKFQHNIPIKLTKSKHKLVFNFSPKDSLNARLYFAFTEKNGMQKAVKTTRLNSELWLAPPSVSAFPDNIGLSDWRYYTGAFLTALFDVSNHFKLDTFRGYFKQNMAFFLKNKEKIRAERKKYGLIDSPFSLYFRSTMLDDLGTQSLATLIYHKYLVKNDPEATAVFTKAQQDWQKNVNVLPDGTFTRLTPDSMTVQSDDLMMGGFSLVRMSQILKNDKMLDDAARASIGYHTYLFDNKTKLYRHAFSTKTKEQSCCSWARGLGWMMLTNAEILKNAPPQYQSAKDAKRTKFKLILQNFQATCAALLPYQNENGAFHQILTDKNTYLETSATAMFIGAFADGVTQGWLPKADFELAILRGWAYLKSQIQDDGKVKNIVRGTPILTSTEAYNQQKANLNDPRGLGAVLWACIAMDKFLK
ncbi:MAG: hypothetical protein HC817_01365 [Saprospiraceae bacterium]|nr:hypothetical protein [Saprospiraceae bacterium]